MGQMTNFQCAERVLFQMNGLSINCCIVIDQDVDLKSTLFVHSLLHIFNTKHITIKPLVHLQHNKTNKPFQH
jgi:hypothetical protein